LEDTRVSELPRGGEVIAAPRNSAALFIAFEEMSLNTDIPFQEAEAIMKMIDLANGKIGL